MLRGPVSARHAPRFRGISSRLSALGRCGIPRRSTLRPCPATHTALEREVPPEGQGAQYIRKDYVMNVFRTNRPSEILALAGAMLGGLPTSGVVVLFFAKGRASVAGRVETPIPGDEQDWVADVTSIAAHYGADSLITIHIADESAMPEVKTVVGLLAESDLTVYLSLLLTQNEWIEVLNPANRGLGSSADIAAETRALGVEHKASYLAFGTDAVPPPLSASADEAATEWILDRESQLAERMHELPDVVERALQTPLADVGDEDAALMILAISWPNTRDVVMMTIVRDVQLGHEHMEANQQWLDGNHDVTAITAGAAILMGVREVEADYDRLEAGTELLRSLANRTPSKWRPMMLTTLSWHYFSIGRTGTATTLAEQARKLDNSIGLLDILDALYDSKMNPVWVEKAILDRLSR